MEPFKNELSLAQARRIAAAIARAHPPFPSARFLRGLGPALEPLELKARVVLLADRIESCLNLPPPALFGPLIGALARDERDDSGLRGFQVWPLTELVARRGLDHFQPSMRALEEMTRRFTAEFAVRPFLRVHRDKTLRQLLRWTRSRDEHLRRLASEGSRPLLPWGDRLPGLAADPGLTLPILRQLRADPAEYVRRSVANHLNDHSKTHPGLVIDELSKWQRERPGDADLRRLIRHACRTLLKSGHPGALRLNGYPPPDALEVSGFALGATRVAIGGRLPFSLVVRNRGGTAARVMLDYAVHHRRADGRLAPKVFKGRTRELAPGERWRVGMHHAFREVTTRRLYPGRHRLGVLVNGRETAALEFDLV